MRAMASSWLFPAMFVTAIGSVTLAVERGVSVQALLALTSLVSILLVALFERLLPYEPAWNRAQGDLGADAAYLPTTIVVAAVYRPAVALLGVVIGGWVSRHLGVGLWPIHWPVLAQFALACVVAEFFDYWAHRVMHEVPLLWRLHATHHSAPRLYWLNATRAHPGEMLFRGAVETLPLGILGVSDAVLVLLAVVNIVVGLFQHANIDFRLGPLGWIFSVGELHRWHHSRHLEEANRNYGNNFIFWDTVFGTRFLPTDRKPPTTLGIEGLDAFPRTFGAQLLSPLRWTRIVDQSRASSGLRTSSR